MSKELKAAGPDQWDDIIQADEQLATQVADPAPEMSDEARTALREQVQVMLNLRAVSQSQGFQFLMTEIKKRLESLRSQLEEGTEVDAYTIAYQRAGVRVYKEVLAIVPAFMQAGEEAAEELRKEL